METQWTDLPMKRVVVFVGLLGCLGCTTCPQAGLWDRLFPSRNACAQCSRPVATVIAADPIEDEVVTDAEPIVVEDTAAVATAPHRGLFKHRRLHRP
jgi:hypothetical protein